MASPCLPQVLYGWLSAPTNGGWYNGEGYGGRKIFLWIAPEDFYLQK